MKFRKLHADEIDVRVGQVGKKSVSLLLYKDARVDMSILDETVGPDNWQREHYELKGNLFCRVGIRVTEVKLTESSMEYATNQWVWKSDVGTESSFDKVKGEASDSFKRACVNWGIGRELYSGPKIYISLEDAEIKDGKASQFLKFRVSELGYDENGEINRLTIMKLKWNGTDDHVVYSYGLTEDLTGKKPAPSTKTERTGEPAKEFKR